MLFGTYLDGIFIIINCHLIQWSNKWDNDLHVFLPNLLLDRPRFSTSVWWYIQLFTQFQALFYFFLAFAISEILKHFVLFVNSELRHQRSKYGTEQLIWDFDIQHISDNRLLFVYMCAERTGFYPNCAYRCCHDSSRKKKSYNNKYLFYVSVNIKCLKCNTQIICIDTTV